ncbi:hypothetical protein N0V93_008862 [Gnomoniopsis smithogilvyi]|uniref:Calpain catalytic domain-containing protein n=1 Tax=Gnomoniopsis smithogilvyi TaxID=1191159 RepID=A0A9W8YJD2_9PEZI|nr:hypothetical protein N0V93_008862 [Gnomoniopsis smithogilvyi]
MGDIRSSSSGPSRENNLVAVDPYALVQAILGSRTETSVAETERTVMDYDDLPDLHSDMLLSSNDRRIPEPDEQPKNVRVGAANPYALVEAILGRRIDRNSVNSSTLISQVLQTDYDELFDMKNNSVLFAGLRLNEKERRAEQLSEKDIRLLRERDLVTPDLSRVHRLSDLQQIGIKDLNQVRVKHARLANGKIRLVINANSNGNRIARQVTNRELTRTLSELMTPFRIRRDDDDNDNDNGGDDRDRKNWSPPNGSWRDMYDYFFQSVNRRLINDVTNFSIGDGRRVTKHYFDDPEQGAAPNSWFVAALFSVFWADPASINRATRVHPHNERNEGAGDGRNSHRLRVRFHDKGGNNNNRTETVEVNYEIPITNSSSEPVYCRASDRTDIWPSLYEKAFAKWISGSNSDRPDITVTHSGDPIKAMAQMNGREPQYYRTENHDHNDLLSVVRNNCVNNRTINPMCAWTHATGQHYRGSNLVANHAYSVCGYAIVGDRQYIVLRNPWGVTEPQGLTSYPGILNRMDPELWQPAELLDQGGLFAMETQPFREVFQYMGVANGGK